MKGQPFKRLQLFLAMASMESRNSDLPKGIDLNRPNAFYYSRGHGGKTPHRTGHKHMAYVRKQNKLRNRK